MWKCSSYAGMMELVDMRDLGDVTSVKGFCAVPRRGHSSVKAGSPVFINAGQAVRSASAPRRVKIEDHKIAAGFLPFLSAPVVELADTMDFGAVTLVKGFCAILAVDILR